MHPDRPHRPAADAAAAEAEAEAAPEAATRAAQKRAPEVVRGGVDVGDAVPDFGFSALDLPPEDNVRIWRDAVSTLFEVDDFRPEPGERFRADLSTYALGPAIFAVARASGQRFTRSLRTIAASGIDHVIVQLYLRGGYDGLAGPNPIRVRAGDVCVLDLAHTLQTRATAFENLTFVVPRPKLVGRIEALDALHGLVVPRGSVMAGLMGRHLQALAEFAPRMRMSDCAAVVDGSIDLLAACLRAETERRDLASIGGQADAMIRIRQHIDARLSDPDLSIERLQDRFGLSRASLYRLFAPHGGITSYIRSRRLHRAFFDLADPNLSLKDVIRRWQFTSQDSFSRAFKSAYGISPKVARFAAQGSRIGDLGPGETSVLSHWMRNRAAP